MAHFKIAIIRPVFAATVLLDTSSADIPSCRCLQQQQQQHHQRFKRQPLGGLQDLGEKDVMGAMILIEDVLTLLLLIKDC